MSVIYNEAKLKIKTLNNNVKIKKIFGMDKLYSYNLKDDCFETTILQYISGKEYTFTIEFELPNVISINDNLFEVEFIGGDNDQKYNQICQYKIVGGAFSVADEEYLKSKVFDTIDIALKLKEENKNDEMNKILNEMKNWIIKNYEGINKNDYLRKINETFGLIQDNYIFESRGRSKITADIYENQLRRGGNFAYSNKIQSVMISQSKTNSGRSAPYPIPYFCSK